MGDTARLARSEGQCCIFACAQDRWQHSRRYTSRWRGGVRCAAQRQQCRLPASCVVGSHATRRACSARRTGRCQRSPCADDAHKCRGGLVAAVSRRRRRGRCSGARRHACRAVAARRCGLWRRHAAVRGDVRRSGACCARTTARGTTQRRPVARRRKQATHAHCAHVARGDAVECGVAETLCSRVCARVARAHHGAAGTRRHRRRRAAAPLLRAPVQSQARQSERE